MRKQGAHLAEFEDENKNAISTRGRATIQPFLTSEQACELMQIGLRTLYKLMAIGLPYYKIGGCTRFSADDLMGWLQGCKQVND